MPPRTIHTLGAVGGVAQTKKPPRYPFLLATSYCILLFLSLQPEEEGGKLVEAIQFDLTLVLACLAVFGIRKTMPIVIVMISLAISSFLFFTSAGLQYLSTYRERPC